MISSEFLQLQLHALIKNGTSKLRVGFLELPALIGLAVESIGDWWDRGSDVAPTHVDAVRHAVVRIKPVRQWHELIFGSQVPFAFAYRKEGKRGEERHKGETQGMCARDGYMGAAQGSDACTWQGVAGDESLQRNGP